MFLYKNPSITYMVEPHKLRFQNPHQIIIQIIYFLAFFSGTENFMLNEFTHILGYGCS